MRLAEKAMKKDELFGEFRRYAVLKRQQKRNPDAMDVDAVNQRKRDSKRSSGRSQEYNWPWIQACTRPGQDEERGRTEEWEEVEWGQIEKVCKGNGKGNGEGMHGENAIVVGNGGIQRQLPIVGQGIQWDVLELWDSTALGQVLPESEEDNRQGQGEGEERKRELEK